MLLQYMPPYERSLRGGAGSERSGLVKYLLSRVRRHSTDCLPGQSDDSAVSERTALSSNLCRVRCRESTHHCGVRVLLKKCRHLPGATPPSLWGASARPTCRVWYVNVWMCHVRMWMCRGGGGKGGVCVRDGHTILPSRTSSEINAAWTIRQSVSAGTKTRIKAW